MIDNPFFFAKQILEAIESIERVVARILRGLDRA